MKNGMGNAETVLKRVRGIADQENNRRSALATGPVLIRVNGEAMAEIDNPVTPISLFLPDDVSLIEVLGQDREGEVVIAAYQLIYGDSRITTWQVLLPWNEKMTCTFQCREDGYVRANFKSSSPIFSRIAASVFNERSENVGIDSLSPAWLKARVILDFLGRGLIPIAAIFLITFYTGKQESLRRQEAAHELDLGFSQSFQAAIASEDPTRRVQAIALFRAMNSRLAAMLAPVAATVDPIAAANRSADIAADRSEDAQTRSTAEESRRQIMMDFRITEPPYGAEVGLNQTVRGITPFRGMHHYIVVQTPQGDEVVMGEAHLSGNSWEGIARFGQAGAGVHEEFHVRVIATTLTLSEGPFQEPTDAMSSDSIAVNRRD